MEPWYIALTLVPEAAGQHAGGQRLLRLLDGACFPQNGCTPVIREPGGRPFFADRHADFSISHSRRLAACAYAPSHTGCDVQFVKPLCHLEQIAARQFTPGEQAYLNAAATEDARRDRFYQIWVLKECSLKLQGRSVFAMKTAPSFADANGLHAQVNAPQDFFLYALEGETGETYFLAAAHERNGDSPAAPPECRWFSAPLPVRSLAVITHRGDFLLLLSHKTTG